MKVVYRCNREADFPALEMSKQSVEQWVGKEIVVVSESEYFKQPFMLADLGLIADFTIKATTDLMFIDTDVLVRDDIGEVLKDEWDFCVTWRDNMGDLSKLQPYNFGVWWVRRSLPSIWATTWMYRRCLQLMPESQNWYGNQIALRELLGAPIKTGIKDVKLDCGRTLRVKMLPGDVWNYTPAKEGEDVSGKKILHFKGAAKGLMQSYLPEALR